MLAQTDNPALQPATVASRAASAAGQLGDAAAGADTTGQPPVADLEATLQKIITQGQATIDQVDRGAVVNVVMPKSGVTRPEAELRTDAWIKQYQDAREQFERKKAEAQAKARQVADDAASATSKGAFGASIALILGAIAAALGGMAARRKALVVTSGLNAGYNAN